MNALRSVKSACRAIRKNIRDWFMEGYGIPFDPQWDDLNTNSRSIYGKGSYETEPRAEQIQFRSRHHLDQFGIFLHVKSCSIDK